MKTKDELLKAVKKAEYELKKFKDELEAAEIVPSLPSWGELIGNSRLVFNFAIGTELKEYTNKANTLYKLLAVADYVNDGWKTDFEKVYVIAYEPSKNKIETDWLADYSTQAVHFNSEEAAQKAIEIFKANNSEQELIDFFK